MAVDLTQDLFLQLIAARPSAVIHDTRGYLFRAASNLASNHNRRERLLQFDDGFAVGNHRRRTPDPERIPLSRSNWRSLTAGAPEGWVHGVAMRKSTEVATATGSAWKPPSGLHEASTDASDQRIGAPSTQG